MQNVTLSSKSVRNVVLLRKSFKRYKRIKSMKLTILRSWRKDVAVSYTAEIFILLI